jgi:hypothetical protein
VAAQPVLGLPELWPPLLDHVPVTARRASGRCAASGCDGGVNVNEPARQDSTRRIAEKLSPLLSTFMDFLLDAEDDEDDEILDDEEFDEEDAGEDVDEDPDAEDEEEEETWQVARCLDFIG